METALSAFDMFRATLRRRALALRLAFLSRADCCFLAADFLIALGHIFAPASFGCSVTKIGRLFLPGLTELVGSRKIGFW